MEIELQNRNNVNLELVNDSATIDFIEQQQQIETEDKQYDVNLEQNNVQIEIGTKSIVVQTNDHSLLNNLGYKESGHIGFQEQMGAITNIEIERMWNSV